MTRRVLLGEDDADLRDLLVGFLTGAGWEVRAMTIGRDDAHLAGDGAFAFAIVDVRPTTSLGLARVRSLRACEPGLPILVLTSFSDAPLAARLVTLGVTHILEKPFDLEDLERAVEGVADRYSSGAVW
jgi:DNA-binding response OmpR family regulator